MKPGVSRDVEGVLPIAVTKARARERVSGEVCSAVMISTPGWMGTGFMKWVLRTRWAAAGPAAAASLVIERLEVLVARMASGGVRAGRREKMSSFRERISWKGLLVGCRGGAEEGGRYRDGFDNEVGVV
jgi:hypothetical protein